MPESYRLAFLADTYSAQMRDLKRKCEAHDQIEGETIDALRALFEHATPETIAKEIIAVMQTWHSRHNPIEWDIVVAFAMLPKELADSIREEGF